MKTVFVTILCLLVMYSCSSYHSITKSMQAIPFDKEGHRGCRGLMPENTIPAMIHAIDLDVTTLEMDVHITKDSQVVLSHDPWMNPAITTRPDGSYLTDKEPKYILYNMTYDSIRRFDVGYKPYPLYPKQQKIHVSKPLLTALIDSVEAYCRQKSKRVFYNIEIKSSPNGDDIYHPKPERYADLLMQVLQQKGITKYTIIQSFDVRPLQYLHVHYPQMQASMLVDGTDHRSFQEIYTIAALHRPARCFIWSWIARTYMGSTACYTQGRFAYHHNAHPCTMG